jgi:hypothetical protein
VPPPTTAALKTNIAGSDLRVREGVRRTVSRDWARRL